MDGGAWWAIVRGVAESRTRLSDFTFTVYLTSSPSPLPPYLIYFTQFTSSACYCVPKSELLTASLNSKYHPHS